MFKNVIKEEKHPAGFLVKTVEFNDGEDVTTMDVAYTVKGKYIGAVKDAVHLVGDRGIQPQLASRKNAVCSIGFCEKEQKWFGWSHRAIYGFGIGSTISPGDCGYQPSDIDDWIAQTISFWTDAYHENVTGRFKIDEDNTRVLVVSWTMSETVPNQKLRGTISSLDCYPPTEFGRGSWTAKTLEDAKQMAIAFAEGVS